MRSRLKKVLVTLLTGLLIAVVTPGHSLFSRPVTVPQHFRAEFLPEGVLVPGVPFHIRIRLTAVTGFCKPFTVSYDKMGTLELLEAPVTQHAVDSGQSFETTVLVKCKANDTSTIRVRFSCVGKGSGDQTRAWLVSDDSSVVVLQKYPSRKPAVKPDPKAIQKERFRKDAEADSARYRRIDDIKHAVPQITPLRHRAI